MLTIDVPRGMFALLRQLTQLDDTNVFADDQGKAQWPDIVTYSNAPAFDVAVRFWTMSIFCLSLEHILLFFSSLRLPSIIFPKRYELLCFRFSQCAVETCGYHVSSGIADGVITSEA
jgi:hypothetical protein